MKRSRGKSAVGLGAVGCELKIMEICAKEPIERSCGCTELVAREREPAVARHDGAQRKKNRAEGHAMLHGSLETEHRAGCRAGRGSHLRTCAFIATDTRLEITCCGSHTGTR